jgi:pimeloyl-ACP methyl ester carboxylesterase
VLRTTIAAAPDVRSKTPLVFVHGGSHTGACYVETPDGRSGWAPYAAARGRTSYVFDWPGHGVNAAPSDFATMSMQATADALVDELAQIGPAVLVTHSMGGVVGWRAAEMDRRNIAAIVAIAPGPPANLQPLGDPALAFSEDAPVQPMRDMALKMWANSERFPHLAFETYLAALVPESPRAMNERNNLHGNGVRVAGPEALAGIPVVVITGDSDPRHPREVDAEVAAFAGADFIWLADRGLTGHGHMMMIEHGHDVVADIFLDWLDARGI